ncbi:MAG TPA: glutamyl-tRNA reductase [Longimicrobiales bacterium]|nr:glutamyl-tRNA reductase [Longimicrobiales bacterium]
MSVAVVGVSHRTAPLEVRERFVVDAQASASALRRLAAIGCTEAVLLSTCNRTELYMRAPGAQPDAGVIGARFLSDHAGMPETDADRYLYTLQGDRAVEHLFRVVASLDSMILGEAQIQGQVKAAYERAVQTVDSDFVVGPVLARLFETALRVGGRVRSETKLGTGAASVPSASIELAQKIFGSLQGRRALVLGAGDMSELTMECLRGAGVRDIMVANRTAARAEEVSRRLNTEPVTFEDVPRLLREVDIVAAATSAPHAVITREVAERALAGGRRTPLLILDIALPRDVEREVGELPNVFLYDIDDLSQVVEGNLERRRSEIAVAEQIIQEGTREFRAWYRARNVVPLIRELRGRAEDVREAETARALRTLSHLSPADRAAVENLTRQLLNKVLHSPTARLREAAADGRGSEMTEAVRYLFGLGNAPALDEDAAPKGAAHNDEE